jgi:hypothetical protein
MKSTGATDGLFSAVLAPRRSPRDFRRYRVERLLRTHSVGCAKVPVRLMALRLVGRATCSGVVHQSTSWVRLMALPIQRSGDPDRWLV